MERHKELCPMKLLSERGQQMTEKVYERYKLYNMPEDCAPLGPVVMWPMSFSFVADQLIGASGEQLSFAVYWIMWGSVIAYHTVLLDEIPRDYFDIVVEAI